MKYEMKLCVIKISVNSRLEEVLNKAIDRSETEVEVLQSFEEFSAAAESGCLKKCKLVFAAAIPASGVSLEVYKIIDYLQSKSTADSSKAVLDGSSGGVIVDGDTELYTKDIGRKLIFAANLEGCSFPGKPLVEATASLNNFKVLSKLWNTDLKGAYLKSCESLMERVWEFSAERRDNKKPNVLAIHAGSHKLSNSLALWRMVTSGLEGRASIEEISVRNGQVWDCRGCKYEDCLHFGENGDCFYGGVMVEKVYPAILKCDILVLICPNYNDSVSANIMAFINRLTAVFRANDFSRKRVYAIIVSGYSGSDLVAQQIIGAININKSFALPASFSMMETANDPGDIEKSDGISARAKAFADKILGDL